MGEGPLLSPEEFTIRQPLFWAGVAAFFLGTCGGLYLDGVRGFHAAFFLDLATLVVLAAAVLAVRFFKLPRSRAVAIMIYAGSANFLFAIVQALSTQSETLDTAVYNNLFILSLFLGISTFLVGRSSSLIFGATILAVLLAASRFWNGASVAGNLWFEVPAVVGVSVLLYRYRGALDQLLADLQRVIRENKTLRDRERLAALGEMTAGIAHEIKNPLNFVVNFAESSQELLRELEELQAIPSPTKAELDERSYLLKELRQNLEDIKAQGLRGASIVQGMLAHARSGSGEFQAVDLNVLAEESLNLASLGHRVRTVGRQLLAWPAPVMVKGSRSDLSRAILNLVVNALWSASERGRREGPPFSPVVSVKVEAVGTEARVTVSDNGLGFSEAIRAQLFVPFFTTKPTGEGTGLGLALTWEVVVDQHGGRIEVQGEPDKGARFSIVLPLLGAP